MLPAGSRLRRRDEFATAVRRGRRGVAHPVVVHLLVRDDGAPPRAGFVVSRAVGSAVVRNTVRRRLRHAVAGELRHLPSGADLIVRAEPASATAAYPELRDSLAAAIGAAQRPKNPRPRVAR